MKRMSATVTPDILICTTAIGSATGPIPVCKFMARLALTILSSSEFLPKGRQSHEAPSTLKSEGQPHRQSCGRRRGRAAESSAAAAQAAHPDGLLSVVLTWLGSRFGRRTAGLCQPVERDIYDCYVTCFWPAQVPDHLNNYPDWASKCAAATKDWRNLDLVFPIAKYEDTVFDTRIVVRRRAGRHVIHGAYPDSVIVFDEGKGQVVEKIPLVTGLPTAMRLSLDRKEDLRHHQRSQRPGSDRCRDPQSDQSFCAQPLRPSVFGLTGGVADPQDKVFYTVTTEMNKLNDRYEIGKLKYTVIDLAQQKIVKTVDIAKDDENANAGYYGRAAFEVSPDGKYLYQFRDKVVILNADDFKVVDRIDLARPDFADMENIGFGGGLLDSIGEPGKHISLFNSADPIVHNRVFGIRPLRFEHPAGQLYSDRSFTARHGRIASGARQKERLHGHHDRESRKQALRVLAFDLGNESHHPNHGSSVPLALQLRHGRRRQEVVHLRRGIRDRSLRRDDAEIRTHLGFEQRRHRRRDDRATSGLLKLFILARSGTCPTYLLPVSASTA